MAELPDLTDAGTLTGAELVYVVDGPSGTPADARTTVGAIAALASGGLEDVDAGTGISIDKTDPANPVISATGTTPDADGVTADATGHTVLTGTDVQAQLTQADTALAAGAVGGIVVAIQEGTGISVDSTDPTQPIVSATGGGAVDSVNGATGVVVLDSSDIADDPTGRGGLTGTDVHANLDMADAAFGEAFGGISTLGGRADAIETKLDTIETNADVTDQANVAAAGAAIVVDAGDDLTQARPAGAVAVYWLFDVGTVPGTDGENIVNGVEGDQFYVRAS